MTTERNDLDAILAKLEGAMDVEAATVWRYETIRSLVAEVRSLRGPGGPLDLDAIDARAKSATPGPWVAGQWSRLNGSHGSEICAAEISVVVSAHDRPSLAVDDLDFIAHAREDVPKLVARVRELEVAVDTASRQLDESTIAHAKTLIELNDLRQGIVREAIVREELEAERCGLIAASALRQRHAEDDHARIMVLIRGLKSLLDSVMDSAEKGWNPERMALAMDAARAALGAS
jgi:hypothetical protein